MTNQVDERIDEDPYRSCLRLVDDTCPKLMRYAQPMFRVVDAVVHHNIHMVVQNTRLRTFLV